MQRFKPKYIIMAVVALLVGVIALPELLAEQPGSRSVDGSQITETVGVVDTNTSATFTIRLLEGSDAEHESDHIFQSLMGLPGVGKATLDTETLALTVNFDSAVMSEEPIGQALIANGYVTPSVANAASTEVAPDGSVQRIAVIDDGTQFRPSLIRAQAGVPIQITFAPGVECRVIVKFPEIGIQQDISQGGTVALPPLEPGEYQIACSGDSPEGTLIVE